MLCCAILVQGAPGGSKDARKKLASQGHVRAALVSEWL